MDLKTFAEIDFDPKQWINRAWNTSGTHEKEVFVANTVARLQLYMKQLTNSLDETTTQIVSSVPRILQDASTLQVESTLLQQKLFALERQVQGVQQETGHSIESLQRIDQLKSKLENAASALREADKWAALVSSLEDMLDSGVPTQPDKLVELADQVKAMTASLEVLVDAPDYDKKRVQLEILYNRLEAAISPPLIEALTQMDAERTSPYVSVLRGMSRGVSACRCWRRAAAARAAPAWRRHAAAAPPLTPHHHQQLEWLTNVLQADAPLAELVALYTDLLLSFDPTPTKVVTAKFKLCQSAEEGVNLLLDVRAEIDEFVHGVRSVVDAPKTSKEIVPSDTLREFGRAAYAPLRALLPEYTELQTQLFLSHLQQAQLQQEGLLEYSRAVLSITERCEGWFAAAYEKARTIAGQAAYTFYAPAAEAFIAAILSLVSTHTRRIEAAFNESEARGSGGGGGGGGVLSETFPAALVLQDAAASLLPVMQRLATAIDDASETPVHPLDDMAALLLEGKPRSAGEETTWGAGARHAVEQLRTLARNILRAPPHRHLDTIPQLSVWCNNDALSTDLPDFALSPQEYITEIGQYLMTLPQHLEMHLSEKQAPWQFLNDVCTHTCEVYAEKILNIRNMDALGTKRCLTDIVYLSSVLEDLGSSITPALKNLEKSLRAAITTTQNE